MRLLHISTIVPYVSLEMKELAGERAVSEILEPFVPVSPHLLLDLKNQTLNSMSIGTLAQVVSLYKNQWGEENFVPVNLVGVNPGVLNVFKLANIEEFFQVWPDVDAYFKAQQKRA